MNKTSYKFLNKNWLSQFNLYKDESADLKKSTKKYSFGIYFTLAMILFISLLVCLVAVQFGYATDIPVAKYISVTEKSITEPLSSRKSTRSSNFEDTIKSAQVDTTTIQYFPRSMPLQPPKPFSNIKQNLIDYNLTKILPTDGDVKLLEREDSQPINLSHSQHRRKVKIPQARSKRVNEINGLTWLGIRDQIQRPPTSSSKKNAYRRRHIMDDMAYPRPFNFLLNGPQPSQFRKNKKLTNIPLDYTPGNVNSIQDILQRIRDPLEHRKIEPKQYTKIQISGKYRHPKGKGITRLFNTAVEGKHSTRQENFLNQYIHSDPLFPYKPRSPSEINHLAIKQLQMARLPDFYNSGHSKSVYQQSHIPPDLEKMYSKIISASNNRQNDLQNSRNGNLNNVNSKPFSLMLDVYPMHEDQPTENSVTSHRSPRNKHNSHFHPQLVPSAVNSLPYSYQLDNSYYNGINFPQVQQNRFPQPNQLYQNSYMQSQPSIDQDHRLTGSSYHDSLDGKDNPSQIMVQLNLFPKNKKTNKQRTRNTAYDSISPVFDDRISDASETHTTIIERDSIKNISDNAIDDKRHDQHYLNDPTSSENKDWNIESKDSHNRKISSLEHVDLNESSQIVNSNDNNLTPTRSTNNSNRINDSINFKLSDRDVIKFGYQDAIDSNK